MFITLRIRHYGDAVFFYLGYTESPRIASVSAQSSAYNNAEEQKRETYAAHDSAQRTGSHPNHQ
jgi:hypothetical protein